MGLILLLAFNFYPRGNHNIHIDGHDHSSSQLDSWATKGYVPTFEYKGRFIVASIVAHSTTQILINYLWSKFTHLWQWFVLMLICIITNLQTIPLNKQYTYNRKVYNLLLILSLGYIKLNVFVYRLHTTTNVQAVIFVRCLCYLCIQSCLQSFYLFSLHNINLQWIVPLGSAWGSSCHSINVFKKN